MCETRIFMHTFNLNSISQMKKKIFSALLMGVFTLASMSMFVSCKDYDDDINDLRNQIEDLATSDELQSRVEEMTAAIADARNEANEKAAAAQLVAEAAQAAADKAQQTADGAQAVADAAKAKADELEANGATKAEVEAAKAAAAKAQETADQAKADATKAYNDLKTKLDEAVKNAGENYDAAMAAAEEAKQAAADAKAAAEKAYSDAAGLVDAAKAEAIAKADAAKAAADEVQKVAEQGVKDAAAALEAAKAAQATADQALGLAQTTAESVKTVQNDITVINTNLGNLDTRLKSVEAWITEAEAKGEMDDLKFAELVSKVDSIDGALKAIIGEYSTMVTSVSLYASQGLENGLDLTFVQATEKENKFPAKVETADKQFVFTEGTIKTYETSVVVRVSPTNAVLNKDNITLINSQGVELSDYVVCSKVERYNELLVGTRAATTGNGLWTVTLKLKDGYDPEAFKAASMTSDGKYVLYAVAVKNTELNEDDRRVISSYDLTVKGEEASHAKNTFDVQGNDGEWRNIDNANNGKGVKNRYLAAENGEETKDIAELSWKKDDEPGTVAILEGDNANAVNRNGRDDRQDGLLLPTEINKAIGIRIDWNDAEDKPNNKIKGFYVTLDYDFAVESAPSEINAWNSYTYEGVGKNGQAATLFEGNTGSITIKDMDNVVGDVIGFRVYAVNLDGTLLDPDGRAFYVAVGNTSTVASVSGEIIATQQMNSESELISVPEGTFINCDVLARGSWAPDAENPVVGNGKVDDTKFTVVYYAADGKTVIAENDLDSYDKIRFVKFVMPDALDFVDGATYTQTLQLYNNVAEKPVLAKTITATMTKKLPTAFPATFAIKTGQDVGNSTIRPFMIPDEASGWVVDGTDAANGTADLKDLLYLTETTEMDPNYVFTFNTSVPDGPDADEVDDPKEVKYDETEKGYFLTVGASYITDEPHTVGVKYLYQGVSAYEKADGNWHTGAHEVAYGKDLNAKYACWHHDMSYDWADSKVITDLNTSLVWTNKGEARTIYSRWITITSSRDQDEFGGQLNEIIGTKKYLAVVLGTAKLTTEPGGKGQINPYFKPEIEASGKITCTQIDTQTSQAPYQNHTEYLSFQVKDVYGHVITIELPVKIVNPTLED